MGQVPVMNAKFLLIGRGRLAQHLHHVHSRLLGQEIRQWHRRLSMEVLERDLEWATHVGLAISDRALADFYQAHLAGRPTLKVVHFSGASSVPGTACAHPVMSFGAQIFSDDIYPRIVFAVTGAESLSEVLPGWTNPWIPLAEADKGLHHAWCVLAGNFPVMMWTEFERQLTARGAPNDSARIYVQQIAANFRSQGDLALTGPLVRGDLETIEKNIQALGASPWAGVYRAFLEVPR